MEKNRSRKRWFWSLQQKSDFSKTPDNSCHFLSCQSSNSPIWITKGFISSTKVSTGSFNLVQEYCFEQCFYLFSIGSIMTDRKTEKSFLGFENPWFSNPKVSVITGMNFTSNAQKKIHKYQKVFDWSYFNFNLCIENQIVRNLQTVLKTFYVNVHYRLLGNFGRAFYHKVLNWKL